MTPRNHIFREATIAALAGQPFSALLGLGEAEVDVGVFEVIFIADQRHLQHDGVVHGGVLATVADTCIALAAHTLVGASERVLTIEFKINFLRPAMPGQVVRCRGEVVRPGRTITVSESKVYANTVGELPKLCAIANGTVATVRDPPSA